MFEKRDKIECLFIGIYFAEQAALILLYVFSPNWIGLWITLFPIVFLTTIAFEKSFMKVDFSEQRKDFENQLKERDIESKGYKRFNITRDQFRSGKFLRGVKK